MLVDTLVKNFQAFNLLKSSCFFTYHQVNIQKFYMVLALL